MNEPKFKKGDRVKVSSALEGEITDGPFYPGVVTVDGNGHFNQFTYVVLLDRETHPYGRSRLFGDAYLVPAEPAEVWEKAEGEYRYAQHGGIKPLPITDDLERKVTP